jgi:hypothetical protein
MNWTDIVLALNLLPHILYFELNRFAVGRTGETLGVDTLRRIYD